MAFIESPAFGSANALGMQFESISFDASDFEEASIVIGELAGYIEEAAAPMRAAKGIAIKDMKDRFDSETDPSGRKWVPLTQLYAERKMHDVGFEHPILTRESTLRDAATSAAAFSVAGDSLFFNTEGLPEYWSAHQFGNDYVDNQGRTFFHTGRAQSQSFDEISQAGTVDDGQHNLPPRPFIGLSDEAELAIIDTFDLWFSKGIDEAAKHYLVSSSGTLHLRGDKGRIGPKAIIG